MAQCDYVTQSKDDMKIAGCHGQAKWKVTGVGFWGKTVRACSLHRGWLSARGRVVRA